MDKLRSKILDYCSQAQTIALMTHINPDGDGFAACLGLQRILRSFDYNSDIVMDGLEYDRYLYLVEESPIKIYQANMNYDLVFVLDCNSLSRIGQRVNLVTKATHVIVIDHHVADKDQIPCDYSYINTSHASVGVVVAQTFIKDIAKLPAADRMYVSNTIYTTILNDTNNFSNANVNAEVFSIASILCNHGLQVHMMHQKYFMSYSPAELRFLGEALATIKMYHQGRILFMYSSLEMLHRNGLQGDEMSSLTRWVQGSKGVQAIVYFRESAPNNYRLSLRSSVLNVNKIAVECGGGGHRSASGCNIEGSRESVEALIKEALIKQLQVWDEENRT